MNLLKIQQFSTLTTKTKQLNRVVVTGLGMVSPLGINVQDSWKRLINSESGIIRIKDLKQYNQNNSYPDVFMSPVHIDFPYDQWKLSFTNNNLNKYAMAATDEAIRDSGLEFGEKDQISQLKLRTGVNIGVMNSNIPKLTDILLEAGQKGFDKLNRMTILHVLTNMATANVTIKYNLQGPSACSSTACATGLSAIGDAMRLIQLNQADVMIAGGSEDSMCPTNIQSAIKMQAMSVKKYPHSSQSCRPFDKDRSGFILGEGSGIVVLESLEHALQRKAKIYCEIIGYGLSSDGYHLTKPLESGEGFLRAMQHALGEDGIHPSSLDHINCHATSTPVGDIAEAIAITKLLQNDHKLMDKVSISATKGSIGHTFGAAGAIESIFCILSLLNNKAPHILNLEDSQEMPSLNFVRKAPFEQPIRYALKNAFGFGGVNTSMLFKKFD